MTQTLDMRLLPAAATAWAAAAWVSSRPATRASLVLGVGAAALGVSLLAAVRAAGTRPPRHRADRRPGAGEHPERWYGPPCAALVLMAACLCTVCVAGSARLAIRSTDPALQIAREGGPTTLVGQVRGVVRPLRRSDAAMVTLRVRRVGDRPSRAAACLRVPTSWVGLASGTRVTVRARLDVADPGQSCLVTGRVWREPQVLAPAQGVDGVVAAAREGLLAALGLGERTGRAPPRAPVGAWLPWPDGARELVVGVTLGDDSRVPAALREEMRATSLTHLSAVSGQHVAMVTGMVLMVAGGLPRRLRALAGALTLVALVVLVGPQSSVLRAATMGAVMLAGVGTGRRAQAIPALCSGIIVLLLVDPWQSRQWGMALSVAATAGIILWSSCAQAALARTGRRVLGGWLSGRRGQAAVQVVAGLVAVPLVAQACCAPLLIALQPEVSVWAVMANVLAAPAAGVVTLFGLLGTIMAPWWLWGGAVAALPATAGCAWITMVAHCLAHLPGAHLPWPGGGPGVVAAAVVSGVVIVGLGRHGRGGE